MPRYPYGKSKIIDAFQRRLDEIERTWPMTGSYERIDPYIVPYLQAGDHYELLVYHVESREWFDNANFDVIVHSMVKQKLIAEGDVAFDLGSNAGAITLAMARLAGDAGHVHAFDPYPWNAAATLCNARLNHFGNVTAHAVGLSGRGGNVRVGPNDSRTYVPSAEAGAQEIVIAAIADYMRLRPRFLKIDIEGAEHDVFDGQDPAVFVSVERLVLEFHPYWIRPRGIDPKDVLRSIERAGFGLHHQDCAAPRYAIDGYVDEHQLFWGRRAAPPR